MASSIFVSDLHLAEERPEANEAFFRFAEEIAPRAQALYILGDLFEYWIGDDDLADPFNAIVTGFLRRLTQGGVRLGVLHGNRDFLMSEAFAEATGAQLLEDPACLLIEGRPTLLMHGDTLCTDDTDYLAWRATARSDTWQSEFLAKPLDERRRTILELRRKSQQVISEKPREIMDVNDSAVRRALNATGATRLIHGHTHRAGHHRLELDGQECERWVLPDWYGPGGYLEISGARARLVRF